MPPPQTFGRKYTFPTHAIQFPFLFLMCTMVTSNSMTIPVSDGFGQSATTIRANPLQGNITAVAHRNWPAGASVRQTNGVINYYGGAFDGKRIWLCPYDANAVVAVDVATAAMAVYRSWPDGFVVPSGRKFGGIVFDGNGSVWLVPSTAGAVVRINVSSGAMTSYSDFPPNVVVNSANGAFTSGAFDDRGFLWLAPHSASHVVKIDVTGSMTAIDKLGPGMTTAQFGGAAFADGHVWFAPYSTSQMIKINVVTHTITIIPGFPNQQQQFFGIVSTSQQIWITGYKYPGACFVNLTGNASSTATDTATCLDRLPPSMTTTVGMWGGGAFDGKSIWLAPYSASRIIRIDAATGTMTADVSWPSGYVGPAEAYIGSVFDGESVWLLPGASNTLIQLRGSNVRVRNPTASRSLRRRTPSVTPFLTSDPPTTTTAAPVTTEAPTLTATTTSAAPMTTTVAPTHRPRTATVKLSSNVVGITRTLTASPTVTIPRARKRRTRTATLRNRTTDAPPIASMVAPDAPSPVTVQVRAATSSGVAASVAVAIFVDPSGGADAGGDMQVLELTIRRAGCYGAPIAVDDDGSSSTASSSSSMHPFALGNGPERWIAALALLTAGVAIVHGVIAFVLKKKNIPVHEVDDYAGIMLKLYSGNGRWPGFTLTFATLASVGFAAEFGRAVPLSGASSTTTPVWALVVACLGAVAPFPIGFVMWNFAHSTPPSSGPGCRRGPTEFQKYGLRELTAGSFLPSALNGLLPIGRWEPRVTRRAFGPVFSACVPGRTGFTFITMLRGVAVGFIASLPPPSLDTTASFCRSQSYGLAAVCGVYAAASLVLAPRRVPGLLPCHALSSIVAGLGFAAPEFNWSMATRAYLVAAGAFFSYAGIGLQVVFFVVEKRIVKARKRYATSDDVGAALVVVPLVQSPAQSFPQGDQRMHNPLQTEAR